MDARATPTQTDPPGDSVIQMTKSNFQLSQKHIFWQKQPTLHKQNLYVVCFRVGLISLVLKMFGRAVDSHYSKSPVASTTNACINLFKVFKCISMYLLILTEDLKQSFAIEIDLFSIPIPNYCPPLDMLWIKVLFMERKSPVGHCWSEILTGLKKIK